MTKKKIISLITSFFFGLTLLLQPVVSFAMTLDELIAAAQKEGEVNTYWHSSRMGKKVAAAFLQINEFFPTPEKITLPLQLIMSSIA